MSKTYGFIVDTNSYAGNFEREMCAYMTGIIGECEVGDEEADLYKKKHEALDDIVYSVADDHGCFRPVTLATTPNVHNNGAGFEYVDGQEEEALAHFKRYMADYYGKQIEIAQGHRGKNHSTWTDEAIDRTVSGYMKQISDAQSLEKPHKYPANNSVMIYMTEKPDKELSEFLKKRAYEFCDYYNKKWNRDGNLQVTGFRIRTLRTSETDEDV